jgi:hypothetical protein
MRSYRVVWMVWVAEWVCFEGCRLVADVLMVVVPLPVWVTRASPCVVSALRDARDMPKFPGKWMVPQIEHNSQ